LSIATLPLAAQSPSSADRADLSHRPRVIVPWRHFGPLPGDAQQTSNTPPPVETQQTSDPAAPAPSPAGNQPAAEQTQDSAPGPGPNQPPGVSTSDSPAETSASPSPAPQSRGDSTIATLTADYAKREHDRDARRQELESAAHNDPTLQALADIQTTRLLLEGEQDRMQSSGQLAKAFSDLAAKLQSDTARVKTLLETRRQSAEQCDAEIARISAEAPELNLALKNLALLPTGGENDELMRRLADKLNQEDQTLKLDQERSQQAQVEIRGLEADERELIRASEQARAKAASFAQTSQDARLNQGLLADHLEFSVQRKRASDELSNTTEILQTSANMRGDTAVQQALRGGDQPQAPDKTSQPVDSLRDCIRRTGDVAACRAAGGGQP
jgi:hypothetical protein